MKGAPRRIKRVAAPALDAKAIGERIASARKQRDWRQQDLADAAGLSLGGVVGWEAGARIPSTRVLLTLSTALKRKVDWLLLGVRSLRGKKRTKANELSAGVPVPLMVSQPDRPAVSETVESGDRHRRFPPPQPREEATPRAGGGEIL